MNKETIDTIWRQLGGSQFGMMVGAKNLTGYDNTLSFKFGRNSSKSNIMHITYDEGADLYDVEFAHVRKFDHIKDATFTGVFFDQLVPIFEKYTGMSTRLGVRS